VLETLPDTIMSVLGLRRTASVASKTHDGEASFDEKKDADVSAQDIEAIISNASETDVSVIKKAEDVALHVRSDHCYAPCMI